MRSPEPRFAALVLAAGASSRLGRSKHLLPYRDGVLLDAVLDVVRVCPFPQRIVTLGGSADEVRAAVDLTGFQAVVNDEYTSGCSSSIARAVREVRTDLDGFVLFLGDQPEVQPATVAALLAERGNAPIAVTRYDDGIGHPFALSRATFPALAALHGDRGVWKLIDRLGSAVARVRVDGPIPRDIDTEADYRALLTGAAGSG
ncbi:nucleotidyltransferase family protein [Microbacterium hominis]|uniref:Nucleotidyltransferase family protein n=1 Tax=Microbacterium hominis TaxID=162426 RepID=A0A7D4Q933_9MICO|nr:nucleotidyltransferase family protein [Microbacterium hominis]QKJ20259.1 nucleotidyltransferase family protein [Microbacterium hominis]